MLQRSAEPTSGVEQPFAMKFVDWLPCCKRGGQVVEDVGEQEVMQMHFDDPLILS